MSAKPVDLATFRAARRRSHVARVVQSVEARVPISLAAYHNAVGIVAGPTELYVSPAQATEIGRDLIRLASIARKAKPNG